MASIERYTHLLSPLRIGNTYFRNRIFSAPTGVQDLTAEMSPSFDHIAYFERKAKGGAAAVNIGESTVCDFDPGDSRYDIVHLKDHTYNFNDLAKLADAINRNGAVSSIELQHLGAASVKMGKEQLGVSDGPNPVEPGILCHAFTEEQILAIIDEFSDAALYAKSRGFGMVQVHGGHGWLVNQFFSPAFNKRTDRWGGSAENRARFAVAICDEIHRKCGKNYPIEMRISGSELFEGGYGIEGGIDFAKQLEGHADIIHVSVGNPHARETAEFTHPGIFKEGGCNVQYAAEIKKYVSTPVATVGGLSDPDQLEEIIATGKADIVVMARGLICEPDMAIKLRTGREKEVHRCLRCFNCVGEMYNNGRLYCTINPESGKDREILANHDVKNKKHVLIAGGGMAGMQAAITAAENGHKVTLCEKSDRLGGVLTCETGVYFKKRVGEFIERQKYMIEKYGIDVRLNTAVTPAVVDEINPDALIAAIGAAPVRPNIPGIDRANVIGVEQAFENPELARGKTLIIGAGRSGMELAIYLKELGKDINIIEAKPAAAAALYASKIKENNIVVGTGISAKEIREGSVLCDSADGEKVIEADTVVLALGVKPLWDEVDALSSFKGEFYQVGDCRQARSIINATGEGWTAANLIGRY